MFASPGTVFRYMLPAKVGAGIGWRRCAEHRLEQGRSWCSQREWWMPYGMMCTAKGQTVRCSLSGRMSLRRATARVLECFSLIHTASARVAAGLRQSAMMPVVLRLLVVSDTLVRGEPMHGMVWSS